MKDRKIEKDNYNIMLYLASAILMAFFVELIIIAIMMYKDNI